MVAPNVFQCERKESIPCGEAIVHKRIQETMKGFVEVQSFEGRTVKVLCIREVS